MSASRDRRVEEVYEEQNDQRLDDLHSKIRTLRGVRVLESPSGAKLTGERNRSQLISTTMPNAKI
jgi:hypothetical protein